MTAMKYVILFCSLSLSSNSQHSNSSIAYGDLRLPLRLAEEQKENVVSGNETFVSEDGLGSSLGRKQERNEDKLIDTERDDETTTEETTASGAESVQNEKVGIKTEEMGDRNENNKSRNEGASDFELPPHQQDVNKSFLSLFGRLAKIPGDSLTASVADAIHKCGDKLTNRTQLQAMDIMLDINLATLDHLASQSQKLREYLKGKKRSSRVDSKLNALDESLTRHKLALDAIRTRKEDLFKAEGSNIKNKNTKLSDEQKEMVRKAVGEASENLHDRVQQVNSQIIRSYPGIAFERHFPGLIYRGKVHHGRTNPLVCFHG